jgi:3-phenylpropionate/trans-cinnamate dioxygenase ferredoxin reductase subunit
LNAGAAGQSAAETLRDEGFTGRIVLIGKETDLPYDRIKLSKAMTASVDSILLRPESFYQERNIELLLGKEVPTRHGTRHTDVC